eukprot:1151676-Pelagomonas_calceolata.AAC.3
MPHVLPARLQDLSQPLLPPRLPCPRPLAPHSPQAYWLAPPDPRCSPENHTLGDSWAPSYTGDLGVPFLQGKCQGLVIQERGGWALPTQWGSWVPSYPPQWAPAAHSAQDPASHPGQPRQQASHPDRPCERDA